MDPKIPELSYPVPEALPVPAQASDPPQSSRFSEVLSALGQRIDRGERLAERATNLRTGLDAAQLIALQVGIYRYTEAVDLASKLVDRAANAVRTTMQGQ